MEFCPGGDLYAAIKKGGMSPSEVECCFKQILNGVSYLHSQGVAHRDIKPENLFFDTKGHLKVTFFLSLLPYWSTNDFLRFLYSPLDIFHLSKIPDWRLRCLDGVPAPMGGDDTHVNRVVRQRTVHRPGAVPRQT